MRRFCALVCALVCALLFCAGCATDSDRAMWNDALKDLRGDNQIMRNDFSPTPGVSGRP
jgi:hypothetical protein